MLDTDNDRACSLEQSYMSGHSSQVVIELLRLARGETFKVDTFFVHNSMQ